MGPTIGRRPSFVICGINFSRLAVNGAGQSGEMVVPIIYTQNSVLQILGCVTSVICRTLFVCLFSGGSRGHASPSCTTMAVAITTPTSCAICISGRRFTGRNGHAVKTSKIAYGDRRPKRRDNVCRALFLVVRSSAKGGLVGRCRHASSALGR